MRGENFFNPYKVTFEPVNLDDLSERFGENEKVTPESLVAVGLIKHATDLVVVLGRGDVAKPLAIHAHRVSKSAQAKIEEAGGSVELLPWTRGGYRTR
jgi:large subunit ribosomal protein L15